MINAFLHEQSITQDVYEEELAAVTEEITTTQNEISKLQDHNLDIDKLFNASAWVLRYSSNTWVNADLEGKQRLQHALFPDGLEYSMEEGYSNPRIAKAFNVIDASKASPSKLADHISANWNPFVRWMQRLAVVKPGLIAEGHYRPTRSLQASGSIFHPFWSVQR